MNLLFTNCPSLLYYINRNMATDSKNLLNALKKGNKEELNEALSECLVKGLADFAEKLSELWVADQKALQNYAADKQTLTYFQRSFDDSSFNRIHSILNKYAGSSLDSRVIQ